jgi:hypothetical protein
LHAAALVSAQRGHQPAPALARRGLLFHDLRRSAVRTENWSGTSRKSGRKAKAIYSACSEKSTRPLYALVSLGWVGDSNPRRQERQWLNAQQRLTFETAGSTSSECWRSPACRRLPESSSLRSTAILWVFASLANVGQGRAQTPPTCRRVRKPSKAPPT